MTADPDHSLPLNDGTTLPALGFGTYALKGSDAIGSVASALTAGYRLLDSAVNYENESEVGQAIHDAGSTGDVAIVTTKLPGRDHGYDETIASFEGSLERMGRIDLYLIHWPNPRYSKYLDAWRAMVDLQREGRVRSIGVSNFTERHLHEAADATGVMPAVNQIELHPEFPQAELRRVHADLGVVTESWSPLGEGRTFDDPAVTGPAATYGRTPAQIVLRWHIQLGAIPLPKASSEARQRENLDIFDFALTESEMAAIASLGRPNGRLWGGDPMTNEEM
ncbi:MAG: aldo/keto reductase [Actinomycetes bacterium]